jgi:hypothetical protein
MSIDSSVRFDIKLCSDSAIRRDRRRRAVSRAGCVDADGPDGMAKGADDHERVRTRESRNYGECVTGAFRATSSSSPSRVRAVRAKPRALKGEEEEEEEEKM